MDYRDLDGINISTLKEIRKSPAHYVYRLSNPREDETGLMMGRANHTLIFEPHKWAEEYAVFPGSTRRGKAWDEFVEANPGKTILKSSEVMQCMGVRDAVMGHPIVRQYLEAGEAEQVLQWIDEPTGLLCKMRLDFRSTSQPAILDLKGTSSTEERIFGSMAARLGYHLQAAHYVAGVKANGLGELPFYIVAVEVDPPHDVVPYLIDEDVMYAAEKERQTLLRRVAECRESGRWPSRYEGERALRLPSWAYPEDDDEGFTITGPIATEA